MIVTFVLHTDADQSPCHIGLVWFIARLAL
jgi:hypothetical protein